MNNKRRLYSGLSLMITFVIILIAFFSPIFGGINGLDYLDNLYNSISKGSAYYVPKLKKETEAAKGQMVSLTLPMGSAQQATQSTKLFEASGATTSLNPTGLKVEGDLGLILLNCLADADAMYYNRGKQIAEKYGYEDRQVLYNWWATLHQMEKDLNKQKKFKEAHITALVVKKAVEPSYNYYGIKPQEISERWGFVILSLIFYVVYTIWYGFAFMFIFEGLGMKLGH